MPSRLFRRPSTAIVPLQRLVAGSASALGQPMVTVSRRPSRRLTRAAEALGALGSVTGVEKVHAGVTEELGGGQLVIGTGAPAKHIWPGRDRG